MRRLGWGLMLAVVLALPLAFSMPMIGVGDGVDVGFQILDQISPQGAQANMHAGQTGDVVSMQPTMSAMHSQGHINVYESRALEISGLISGEMAKGIYASDPVAIVPNSAPMILLLTPYESGVAQTIKVYSVGMGVWPNGYPRPLIM